MSSIRQLPSGRYNVQIRMKNAKPISQSFDCLEDAKKWAQDIEGATHKVIEPKEPILSFRELGRRYCTIALNGRPSRFETQRRVEHIASHLPKDTKVITKFDVNEYRLMRLEKVSSVTCRDELQLVHRIYRWAHSELILDKRTHPSPCAEITMPPTSKPRNRVIEKGELELLMTELPLIMKRIVELAYETAMRRGEIVKLQAKHIHLEDRILSVVDGKTGDRSVPLTTRATELLRESLKDCLAPESRLFPVAPHSVSTAFRRARKKVGLDDDVRLHQLRHSRITLVARKGFNQAQIMMVSGHRDVRSVQRYTHLSVKDVVDLLD